ncbi:MAG: efflux RND transporter periplasmic adaptor subunit [Bryobacterales bacterium]|nr:efflux RND transporter periplasmic adaptor subunit [Bryobacterales bacterium]
MYITGSESTNQGAAEQARRTFHWCGIVVVAAALAAAGCSAGGTASADSKGGKGGGKKKGDAAAPVTVARVVQRDVPVEVQVIGNVEAYSTIVVRSQVGGELTKVSFKEGDYIRKGDLLFSIDRRQLEAQLSQAEANYAKAKASLGQSQANLARDTAQQQYLQSQAERFARLVKEGVLSKEQGEQAYSSAAAMSETINADGAAIESAKADIAATKAAADNLRVQLTYTEIRSPINGRTGNLMVKQGNLVAANSVDLVTINQIQPIYATFAVPEQQLKSVKMYMAQGKLLVSATPQDDPSGKETGYLTFVDNAVDQATGTIKLKGTFQNEDMKLWPGQFVRVVLRLTTQPNAIVVPNQAVQSGQDGSYVYVVKPNSTVEVRPVTTGVRVEEDLVIEDGLQAGETVVTEGQLRLSPGVRVRIRPGGADGGRQKAGDD